MEQLVRDITTQFVNKLPEDQEFFTPDELSDLSIPEFVIHRVELEMTRNLSDSIVPPYSEWADMSEKSVQKSWQRFIDTILDQVRMPVAHAHSVFETSVGDIVELILQPRIAVPSIIFGPEEVLTKDQLEKNVQFITINKHFPATLLRYMDKKGKDELTKEACKSIVERIDDRLIKNYNPLNWTQLLEPLFVLAGPSVDTNLFRLFFEDKKMNRVARRFDMLNSSLNKTQFIEEMSSPDLLNEEGYEDDQSTFFDVLAGKEKTGTDSQAQEENRSAEKETTEAETEEQDETPDFKFDLYSLNQELEDDQTEQPVERKVVDADDEEDEADTLLTGFHQRRSKTEVESFSEENTDTDEEEDASPLNSRFMYDEESEEEEFLEDKPNDEKQLEETVESSTEPDTLPEKEDDIKSGFEVYSGNKDDNMEEGDKEEGNLHKVEDSDGIPEPEGDPQEEEEEVRPIYEVFGGHNGEDRDEKDTTVFGDFLSETDIPDVEKEPDKIVSEEEMDDPDENGSPIWQAFLSDEDEISDDNIDEDGFIDDPIIDLTKSDSNESDEIEKLSGWLMDDKARFVAEIFGESENAYEQALSELVTFEGWKEASRFIEKEIFSRNMIDMYEEAPVDFTDRLHTYFKEFKSTKTNS